MAHSYQAVTALVVENNSQHLNCGGWDRRLIHSPRWSSFQMSDFDHGVRRRNPQLIFPHLTAPLPEVPAQPHASVEA
jgi:hypothetical protein